MRKKRVARQKFVHLHLHTEHSLLDSIIQIDKLGTYLKANRHWACAITDHGSLTGVYRFVAEMAKHGIKPIVGCEFYWVSDRWDRTGKNRMHVTVLAKGIRGWQKLLRAHEVAYSEGFYRKPRIDQEVLLELAPDCILLSGCTWGAGNRILLETENEEWFQDAHKVFGDDFYLEIQPNEQEDQVALNPLLAELGGRLGIKLVATNDCHYLSQEDWEVHDTLLAVRESYRGKTVLVSDPGRWRYSSRQFNVKNRSEMEAAFEKLHPNLPRSIWMEALDNTVEVAEKVSAKVLRRRKQILPNVALGEEYETPEQKLSWLVWQGWKRRGIEEKTAGKMGFVDWLEGEESLELPLTEVYQRRAKWEFEQICEMGFAQYVLLVWDMISWARAQDIRVGPGRGSVAGSLVAYLIGITAVDSIKYGCPFARFIAPARVDLPDIDVDFPSDCRDRVREYLETTYGRDCVGLISNYDTMQARGALRDVARVWGVSASEVNRVSKEIAGDSLLGALQTTPALRAFRDQYPDVFRIASALEGQVRTIGAHAAGIVISDEPLTDLCPVRVKGKDRICEWDKRDLEGVGLVKLDVLGLEAFGYIAKTIEAVKENRGEEIEPEDFDLADPAVYQAFQKGHTELTWQFNSSIATQTLKRLKPDKFAHLVAASALLRPGPLRSGITEQYLRRRHGQTVKSLDDRLDEMLADTYGLAIYQEDVMEMARRLAGFTWGEADGLRKAVGKKLPEELEKYRQKFQDGAVVGGMDRQVAERIWGQLQEFAAYAFNRAHSTAYAMLSYWTQWFKIHYPLEFLASVLETQRDWSRRVGYVREARRLGVPVVSPDVQLSSERTRADVGAGVIRFGLADVKGVRSQDARNIVAGQPYQTLWDYLSRCGSTLNSTRLLLAVGALDGLTDSPKWVADNLEKLADDNQRSLFGRATVDGPTEPVPYTEQEKVQALLSLAGYPPEADTYEPVVEAIERRCGFKLPTIPAVLKYSSGWYGLVCCCATKVERAKTGRLKVEMEDTAGRAVVIAESAKVVPEGEPKVGVVYLALVSPLDDNLLVSARLWEIQAIEEDGEKTRGIRRFLDLDGKKLKVRLSNLSTKPRKPTVLVVAFDKIELRSKNTMGILVVGGSEGRIREIQIWGEQLEHYSSFWKDGAILRCPIYVRKKQTGRDSWGFSSKHAEVLKILG